MSYILDALKKAEKDRQRGTTPDLLTVQDQAAEGPKKRRLPAYLLVAALLLNVGIFAWLLKPWQENVAPQKAVTQQQAVSVEKILDSLPAGKEITALPGSSEKDLTHNKVPERDLPTPKVETAKTSPASMPAAVPGKNREIQARADVPRQDIQKVPPLESQPLVRSSGIPDARVLEVKELPEPVRQVLPPLSLSVHYYDSSPALRMVSINNRTVREGEEFAAGLRLEEIIPDGAVFSFQGYRFHIGLAK